MTCLRRGNPTPESAEAFYQFGLDSIAERDLPADVKDGLTQGYRRAFAERFLGVLMQEAPEKVGEAARNELSADTLSPEEIDRLRQASGLSQAELGRLKNVARRWKNPQKRTAQVKEQPL